MVSTLSVLTGTGITQLHTVLSGLFTPLSAVSFLLFTLLYTPCVAVPCTAQTFRMSVTLVPVPFCMAISTLSTPPPVPL